MVCNLIHSSDWSKQKGGAEIEVTALAENWTAANAIASKHVYEYGWCRINGTEDGEQSRLHSVWAGK